MLSQHGDCKKCIISEHCAGYGDKIFTFTHLILVKHLGNTPNNFWCNFTHFVKKIKQISTSDSHVFRSNYSK